MLPFSQCNRSLAKKEDEREGFRFEETGENIKLFVQGSQIEWIRGMQYVCQAALWGYLRLISI